MYSLIIEQKATREEPLSLLPRKWKSLHPAC